MPRPTNIRQPISCEPCRKRKTRCSRTRVPCEACQRRGYSSQCTYQRPRDFTLDQPRTDSQASSPPRIHHDELVNRICSLETLLQNHIGAQSSPGSTHQNLAAPLTAPSTSCTRMTTADQSRQFPLENLPPSPDSLTCLPYNTGTLDVSENGYVRYEPRSSQWTSVLTGLSIQASLQGKAGNLQEGIESFPFTNSPIVGRRELLDILPPMPYCDRLKDIYFNVLSPIFHILHDPTFYEEYKKFQDDADSITLSWLALLFVILGIAVAAVSDDDPLLKDLGRGNSIGENIKILSARYLGAATKCLVADHFLWRHNITTLQALVLLIYALNQTHGNTWSLLGMTYNIALALGCHIDPGSFGLSPVKCEERRRCWAGLMMLHMIQNTAMGNINSQRLQHQVRLPADVNDIDIIPDKVCLPSVGATQMSYVLFKFRLYNISANVCQRIFGPVKPSRDVVRALDHEITLEQRSWDTKYLSDSCEEILPVHHIVNLNILYSYSHQLFLLLHRPFFNRESINTNYEDLLESRNRCIDSAQAILDIHKMLCESPQFAPYRWFTTGLNSFHAFHAAVVLAVVWMDADYQSHHNNIQNKLNETLTRFEGLVYRSAICEKAAPILRFLINTASNIEQEVESTTLLSERQLTTQESAASVPDWTFNWDNSKNSEMDAILSRLQPEQWLNPFAMLWEEWDSLMSGNSNQVMQT